MLKEIVEANDKIFTRAGFTGFGASSLDFEVQFDSKGPDLRASTTARTAVGIAILSRLNDEKIEIAFPTQVNMMAAPDGAVILPYARRAPRREPRNGDHGSHRAGQRPRRAGHRRAIRRADAGRRRSDPALVQAQQRRIAAALVVSTDTARSAQKRYR